MAYRGAPWAAVWVRERSPAAGEHLHVAMHLPAGLEAAFVRGGRKLHRRKSGWQTRKSSSELVARSEWKNWDIRRDVRHEPGNPHLLSYLGKAEPNQVRLWGKRRRNERKEVRSRHNFGGRIEGTTRHSYRWHFNRGTLGLTRRQTQ